MKQYTTLLIALFLCTAIGMRAQNATNITALLTKVQNAYMQSSGIALQFQVRVTDTRKSETFLSKGTAKLKKEAFFIHIEEKMIWFDGQKQYTYDQGATEAYISALEGSDELFLNPVNFLKNYSKAFNVTSGGKKQIGGKTASIVQFIPKDKKSEITKMVIGFYDNDSMMTFCEITNKEKQTTRIDVTSYKNGQQFSPATFTFDTKRFPNVEQIDLR